MAAKAPSVKRYVVRLSAEERGIARLPGYADLAESGKAAQHRRPGWRTW